LYLDGRRGVITLGFHGAKEGLGKPKLIKIHVEKLRVKLKKGLTRRNKRGGFGVQNCMFRVQKHLLL
jgi:hypothetical protein